MADVQEELGFRQCLLPRRIDFTIQNNSTFVAVALLPWARSVGCRIVDSCMLNECAGCEVARKLVIHIGAQKCASSSLQASLRLYQQSCQGSMEFIFMNPGQLRRIDRSIAAQAAVDWTYVDRSLAATQSDQVIISHEMLGNRPALVRSLAERGLQQHGFDHVTVVGYTRLQSSYHISAFGQWYFRDRKRLRADKQTFAKHDLPWDRFSALERSLFALVLVGQDRGWWGNYRKLRLELSDLGHQVSMASNHIPTRALPYPLLANFFELAGLQANVDDLTPFDVRKNASFHPIVVHALSVHFSTIGQRESCFPGPHEGNRWLFRVCDRVDDQSSLTEQMKAVFQPGFSDVLVQQINHRCSESNLRYCHKMSVDPDYFSPADTGIDRLTADQLIDLAQSTAQQRSPDEIQAINRQAENVLMRAARAEIIST